MKIPFLQQKKAYAPSIAVRRQNFKGEIPEEHHFQHDKNLGEPHPYNFATTEGLYRKDGLVSAVIDKTVEWVWGAGMRVRSKNKTAEKKLNDWLRTNNFHYHGRRWFREALIKGPAFLELGGPVTGPPQGVKVLNSNHMFVRRDKKGVITGFVQYLGGKERFDPKQAIVFKPEQIAFYSYNNCGDDCYGCGLLYANMPKINHLLQADKSMHTIMERKANSPYVFTLGDREKGEIPTEEALQNYANQLTYLNDRTEWVIDALTTVSTLDFGNIGDKFATILENDMNQLFFGFQTPVVLMGAGNVPEGLAKTQLESYQRRITSIQEDLEKVIEERIFRRVIGEIAEDVEIVWGLPGKEEIEARITSLGDFLKNPLLSPSLRVAMEQELAELLQIDDDLKEQPTPPVDDGQPTEELVELLKNPLLDVTLREAAEKELTQRLKRKR